MGDKPAILIVDDQPDILESLALSLELEGFETLTAVDGLTALEVLESNRVDLALVDISMPGLNGYQLLERIRANPKWIGIPCIFITARTMDSDIRYGKELGVDDYLTKPIHPRDVLAAVRGKLLRARQMTEIATPQLGNSAATSQVRSLRGVIQLGRLRIEPTKYVVSVDDQPVQLSAREYALLMHLAFQPGVVFSVEELVQVTHKFKAYDDEAGTLIRPLIRSLRRKLGYEVGELGCIENVRGVGYRIVVME